MNKKLVLLGAGLLLTAATASAQQHVTGKVTDVNGQPVMGATVRVAGTKIMTTTDASGNFKLKNLPASAKKLNITYIGMQSETVSVAGNVKVVMKDNELGEAVVIGYGSAKKVGTVVGSVKKVGSESVAGKPTPNVADALQGKVAGLQIFSNSGDVGAINSTSIRLRGMGSLGAADTPLLVIDGSPANISMLNMLNDRDIESVTTLKDASATSIYGARAANGVIYITTKRGRANEKAQIHVSQSVGWSQLANGLGDPLSADELLEFKLNNGVMTYNEYLMFKNHGANTNWQKYMFDNAAPMNTTDLSIRGGSGNTTYYVSGSFMQQDGITKISHFDRYTLRTNLETKPKDWLSFGIKQNVTYTDRNSDPWSDGVAGGNVYGNAVAMGSMMPPYWDPYDPEAAKDHMIWGAGMYDVHYAKRCNPRVANDILYNGVTYAQITPMKGLTLRSQLGLSAADTRGNVKVLPSGPMADEGVGSVSESHGRSSLWTMTNTVEYKFDIADKHNITLLAGHEGIKYSMKDFRASGKGTVDDKLSSLGNVTAPDMPSYSSTKYEYLSFFGRVDYSYKDKYYANFTVRNDQSSRFGKDNRGANFFSGGVMWNVMAEDFMASAKGWLTNLQLKLSVGSTGNSEVGDYGSLGLIGNTQYGAVSGSVLGTPANKNLGWEKQIQTNFGITARFFDRLTADVNIYHRKTTDMLMSVPLPSTTGFGSRKENVGGLSNRGIELELSYDVFRTQDAFLNLYANYAFNSNKVDELFNNLEEFPVHDGFFNYVVGDHINYFMPIYAGVDQNDGAPMWYKKGHKGGAGYTFNPETMTKNFSMDLYQDTGKKLQNPHSGGFGLTAGWKGITIAADFTYMLGKSMIDVDYAGNMNPQNALSLFNFDHDFLNYWKQPGDKTLVPGLAYPHEIDTRFLENASFMRMKNLTVSYDLPQRWMMATGFLQNVRFSFTGRNLFTITKYKGADPELDSNFSNGNFPATRQFVLGVEVTF